MAQPLTLGIAGLVLSFSVKGGHFRRRAAKRYSSFLSGARPDIILETRFAAGRPRPFRPALDEAGGILRLRRGDFDCRLDLVRGRGELKLAPRVQAFDSFLRALYSCLLPRRGGLLVHGACLALGGRAYLFPGVSGAGKSTLSRLAAGSGRARIFSDELVPVTRAGGRWLAWGSPFWGEMRPGREGGRLPLAGVLKPVKARRDALAPLPAGRLLRLLLRCTMNFSASRSRADLLLDLAARLASEKNGGELRFSRRGPAFLDLL